MRWRITIDKEQLFSRSSNARGVICWLRCGEGDVEREEKAMGQSSARVAVAENGQAHPARDQEPEQPGQTDTQSNEGG
jgi:hypothetical protein